MAMPVKVMWPPAPVKTEERFNHLSVLRVLCKHGADINQPTRNGDHHTPIMVASQNGFVDSVTFLVKKGAALEHKDTEGMTALMRAAHENKAAVVKLLLDAGASPDMRTLPDKGFPDGATPLDVCKKESVAQMIRERLPASRSSDHDEL